MPATPAGEKAGFRVPPHALFTVRQEDIRHLRREYSRFSAERKVIRGRILQLVQRDDPPTNLKDIIEYAMLEGYL